METKDCNGNILEDGDNVHVTKDLKIKGMSKTLKRGNIIKNIRLTNDSQEVECRVGKAQIVLKTQFLKKAWSMNQSAAAVGSVVILFNVIFSAWL